ncbi:acetyltransferase [Thermoanaerobacterium thermosaccharolyticum]|uniref:acetyltransferase n=1 Tax=Thermoanaerobacterium thermosaccharolyticum TaxID=1517 RepID=UPI0027AB77E0|nr:acetyltransferase [Thermoanaerobacterium thermosaccharolyticum]
MSKKLLLLGGGGHCKSVLDSLNFSKYSEIGIVDKKESIGKVILNIPVIGTDDDLEKLYRMGYNYAFVTVGSTGDPSIRIKLFNILEKIGFEILNVIDPTAIVSKYATLENGIYVGKNAVINAGSFIGKGTIINTASSIDHDCNIGQFVHIAPGCVLCGEVKIGEYTHIGARSVIKQRIEIGANSLIGMGSVVLKNISKNVVAYGNPCKEVKKR